MKDITSCLFDAVLPTILMQAYSYLNIGITRENNSVIVDAFVEGLRCLCLCRAECFGLLVGSNKYNDVNGTCTLNGM